MLRLRVSDAATGSADSRHKRSAFQGTAPCQVRAFVWLPQVRGVFRLRRFGIKLKRSKWGILRWGLGVPGYQVVALGQRLLSKQLLLSCEVAMEYLLALTHSPQVLDLHLKGVSERVQVSRGIQLYLLTTYPSALSVLLVQT